MKGENKRHHYVPQCYLKNFTSNGKSLWVYNKQKAENKIYQQAISNICCKDDFYSLEGIYSNKLLIEKEYFSKNIEPIFSNMLNDIIQKGSKYLEDKITGLILTPEEKYQFAYLLSIQWLRTPYQRHKIYDISSDIMSQMIRIFKEGMAIETGNESIRDLDVRPGINPIIEQADIGYMNNDMLDSYATALSSNYWEFFITRGDYVYTSDFPITVKMHIPNARPFFEGLACEGSELTYPISKNICLTIWDKKHFSDKKIKDSYFTDMSCKVLVHFNTSRYAYANEVYCAENKFDELLQMYTITGKELFALKK